MSVTEQLYLKKTLIQVKNLGREGLGLEQPNTKRITVHKSLRRPNYSSKSLRI